MSINVYLNTEKLEVRKDFQKIERREKSGYVWYEYKLPGINIFWEKGRYHTILHEVEENIPELVKDMVEEISFLEFLPLAPKRILGRYIYKDAVAILKDHNREHNELRIIGKNMESIRNLYYLIRSGKILPKESWEEEQIKPQPVRGFFKKLFKKS